MGRGSAGGLKRSWDILVPTIRKDGSEIIVTMNPELDTDETYVRFIQSPPPDSAVVQVNYPTTRGSLRYWKPSGKRLGDHGQGRLREHLGRQVQTCGLGRDLRRGNRGSRLSRAGSRTWPTIRR